MDENFDTSSSETDVDGVGEDGVVGGDGKDAEGCDVGCWFDEEDVENNEEHIGMVAFFPTLDLKSILRE